MTINRMHRHRCAALAGILACAGMMSSCTSATSSQSPPSGTGTWSVAGSPTPGVPSDLRSIVCESATSCLAVGAGVRTEGLPQVLVEAWDGTAWSVRPSAAAAGGPDSWLNGVSCASPTSCVAVGAYSPTGDGDNPEDHTLIETLTGSTWNVVPSPNPGTGDQTGLQAVTCTSAAWCVAVGSYSPISDPYNPPSETLVETWNGDAWTVVPSPGPAAGSQGVLKSVACTSPSSCVAVGSYAAPGPTGSLVRHALIESWDGASWSMARDAGPGLARRSQLQSVACPSASRCVAVGSFSPSPGSTRPDDQTLVEEWDGSAWSDLSSPNPAGAEQSELQSVSCPSSSTCLAVGSYGTAADLDHRQPLAEWGQAQTWTVTSSPGSRSELASVACVSATRCFAAGRSGAANGSDARTLVESWQAGS